MNVHVIMKGAVNVNLLLDKKVINFFPQQKQLT